MGNSPVIFNGRRSKLLTADGLLTSVGRTLDFDGAVNYVANGGAEVNTTGWATYADAAASSPIDGTGGSPSSTYTRSTSSPLRGQASFLWTKSAANRQGEGFSYDFSIDVSDKAKVLQISFDYLVSSGTYADSDMTIWIYDVTNAALIQPAGYTIQNAAVSMSQKATFQAASNSTSYRLIVHTASTSASAYTLQFDNFAVGPQIVTNGAAVTDWTAYTPTGSWSTNTTYTGFYKRVGDIAQVSVQVALAGAPTSATLTVNLPSGLTIDTAKLLSTTTQQLNLGTARILDSGTAYYRLGAVTYSSTTAVQIESYNTANSDVQVTQAAPFTFASGDRIWIEFEVPISGWSSNVQLSSDTDTRVVAMYADASATSLSAGTTTTIVFTTVTKDTHGAFNGTTFTAPVSGFYSFNINYLTSSVAWTASDQLVQYYSYNGGSNVELSRFVIAASLTQQQGSNAAKTLQLNAGDTLVFKLYSTRAVTLSEAHVNMFRLSGPAVVAASESVNCKYTNTAGTSVANTGTTLIPFNTKAFDSHNAVTTGGSWKFTAPISGVYQVAVSALFDGALYVIGNAIYGLIYKNGASDSTVAFQSITAAQSPFITVAGVSSIRLLAGDYVSFYISNSRAAGATTLNTAAQSNYICITRTGNF